MDRSKERGIIAAQQLAEYKRLGLSEQKYLADSERAKGIITAVWAQAHGPFGEQWPLPDDVRDDMGNDLFQAFCSMYERFAAHSKAQAATSAARTAHLRGGDPDDDSALAPPPPRTVFPAFNPKPRPA